VQKFSVIPVEGGCPIKAWNSGVPFEDKAVEQLKNTARLPFVFKHVAAMPDTHWGIGATVGSVVPTKGAVVPASVGVDIGCGMLAARTGLTLDSLGDLKHIRAAIEAAVPVGRSDNGGPGDVGAWRAVPAPIEKSWTDNFKPAYEALCSEHPGMRARNTARHLGTLGTGNHFIEICLDENERIWVMLHSGSRGMGNRIGTYFIKLAKSLCERRHIELPDRDLAYLPQGTGEYDHYIRALHLAQRFAWENREIMCANIFEALRSATGGEVQEFERVHCHHNYAAVEEHFGEEVLVTRKGAVRARQGDLGIIPGSMGTRSYIVRGKGSRDSFESCSHGAGRACGRNEARKRFTLEDHRKATEGVECDKTLGVLDETPAAYKSIDAVMEAQSDLVEIVHRLKQVVCVKGVSD
jgi:tRNA-splicing ligase RtcB (3'-phosphate/5'-hydroxy nucleic acid ligase)